MGKRYLNRFVKSASSKLTLVCGPMRDATMNGDDEKDTTACARIAVLKCLRTAWFALATVAQQCATHARTIASLNEDGVKCRFSFFF